MLSFKIRPISDNDDTGVVIDDPPPSESKTGCRPKIPKILRDQVWILYEDQGNATGKCYCCGSPIHLLETYQCGHIVPACMGGQLSLSNLRPICANCNTSMGAMNMKDFMEQVGFYQNNARCYQSVTLTDWTDAKVYRRKMAVYDLSRLSSAVDKQSVPLREDQLNKIAELKNVFPNFC